MARDLVANYVGADVGILVTVMLVVRMLYAFADAGLRGYHHVSTAAGIELFATVARVILQVGLVVVGLGLTGMLFGYVAAFGAVGLLGVYLLVHEATFTKPTRRHVASTLQFAKFAWLSSLKTHVSASMDTLVLGFFVTNSLIGVYNASWNLAVVLALASQSLSSALFPELSSLSADDNVGAFESILSEALRYAGLVCIPGVIGLALVGSKVLRIYGSEFPNGAGIALLLGVFALFSSYEGQFQSALNALNRPDLSFRVNALFVVVNITGNVVLVAAVGWIGAAVATTASMGLALVYAYVLTDRHVDVTLPLRDVGHQLAAAALMGVAVYAVQRVTAPLPYYAVVVPIAVGVVVYFAALLAVSRPVREKAFELLEGWRGAV